ncbi:permease-like cell division protein FtsX [Bacillus taeanensis]|uniref:Cell division protein FtsX n=1 Tax=Bacillus taeanensis TaxID=273032 RepID=A0A366Y024_9BACI|nr:permease-like cell division protein FtsX [Bacillus taeanensis]RBW71178.1 cell division protein FtsX [Bacillus taeanensis]
MKAKTFVRHGKEGLKNIGRNGWMTFASVSAVTITLLLVGAFLVILMNLNAVSEQLEESVEIRVHVDLATTPEDTAALQKKIEALSKVEQVTFQPKEQGLKELIESLGDEGKVFSSLEGENPLPDVFIVKTANPQDTMEVASQIEKLEHVNSAQYGKETIERLFKVINTARNIGLIFIIGLIFTAMFLIANTIKLTIVARRKEIEIMKLVGATNSFIRGPFFVEGLLLGVLGSFIPITIIITAYIYLYNQFNDKLSVFFLELLPVTPFIYQLSGLLMFIGAFIGVWGSIVSIRKFLRV